jgi:Leucine-rich repeat (LRR) protein
MRSFYISKKMRLLRVLDLESTYGLVNHHLEDIGSLLHLKYICLRGCRGIYHLPDSWGNLLQLETLDIKGTHICTLPQTIIKLRKLQHLFGGDLEPRCVYSNERIPHHMRELCLACCAPKYLKDVEFLHGDANRRDVCTFWWHVIFPTLTSRRLDPRGIVLPKGVWKLKSLYTLGFVNIDVGKAILQDIRRLTQLRKLAVTGFSKKNCQEFCSALAHLSRLESLSVEGMRSLDLRGLLDDLSTPPPNLRSIKLRGRLGKLPEWIGALQNLVKLKLVGTELSEADGTLQVLGKLPNLAILRLLDESFVEKVHRVHRLTFRQEAPFPSLMMLELYFVCGWSPSLNSVEYEEGATPKLELLRFRGRSDSPDSLFSGLAALPKLKAFELNMLTYAFEANVQAQLAENPNRPIFRKIQYPE